MRDILDRIADLDKRLRKLEASGGSGLSGTDQTIAGSHDRLDALLGAGVASANLVSGVAIGTNVILATIRKTGIADNVATGIFSVTTPNPAGSNDGGAYTCRVFTTVTHLATATSTNAAVEANDTLFQAVGKNDGTSATAIGEITEGGTSATDGATRSIGAVTPSLNAASAYQTDFRLTVDLTGTDVQTAEATCFIVLIWSGYGSAPVIAAL